MLWQPHHVTAGISDYDERALVGRVQRLGQSCAEIRARQRHQEGAFHSFISSREIASLSMASIRARMAESSWSQFRILARASAMRFRASIACQTLRGCGLS